MATYSPPETATTRFLLLSDTHNTSPLPSASPHAFRQPLPPCDVLLHAGDLTIRGGSKHYNEIIRWLSTSSAELKLVIAGNHDIDLDADYYRQNSHVAAAATEQAIQKARAVWDSEDARQAGIIYLEEGVQTFTLRSGATFTVCVSVSDGL